MLIYSKYKRVREINNNKIWVGTIGDGEAADKDGIKLTLYMSEWVWAKKDMSREV